MVEKGRAAIYKGLGHPMEIKEYPLPKPEPGAILIKVTMANICGSDIHIWRGDIDIAALGAPLPMILGHEMTGTVAGLGNGISADSAGQPLAVGDRVAHRIFYSWGRCRACLRGQEAACPMAPLGYTAPRANNTPTSWVPSPTTIICAQITPSLGCQTMSQTIW